MKNFWGLRRILDVQSDAKLVDACSGALVDDVH